MSENVETIAMLATPVAISKLASHTGVNTHYSMSSFTNGLHERAPL